MRSILQQAYEKAVETLKEYRDQLDRLANMLIEEEEVAGEKVLELVGVKPEEKKRDQADGPEKRGESTEKDGSTGTEG